ncbi:MAG: porphobilinogen synthase [Alphaproteobacteria bacterium]|nr:porphobilinogen synthase [Alphaproteobacteria bacterium]
MSFIPRGRFPTTRLRRLRSAPWRRALVREIVLQPADLIQPMFVVEGTQTAAPIAAMPGVSRLTIDLAVSAAQEARDAGIPAIALFPAVETLLKDATGSEALNPDSLVCRAVRAIKGAVPDIGVITDVALDPYTSHGHDGIVDGGDVANDATVAVLARQAVLLAAAGSDVVAPSDMMDGRIGAVRRALDAAGHADTMVLSYAVKYASAFYGPFRDAVGSRGRLGAGGGPADKRTYQMDIANRDEALREASFDVEEGADLLMVKPAGTSLDIISDLKRAYALPIVGYQVSGEYAAIAAAAALGAFDRVTAMRESLTVIKRAGASAVISYAATEVARTLTADVVAVRQ